MYGEAAVNDFTSIDTFVVRDFSIYQTCLRSVLPPQKKEVREIFSSAIVPSHPSIHSRPCLPNLSLMQRVMPSFDVFPYSRHQRHNLFELGLLCLLRLPDLKEKWRTFSFFVLGITGGVRIDMNWCLGKRRHTLGSKTT